MVEFAEPMAQRKMSHLLDGRFVVALHVVLIGLLCVLLTGSVH